MRVSYTSIYTVSESDGRPDGQCGGRGSVSTPPNRGTGYEGKLYLYRYQAATLGCFCTGPRASGL